MFQYKKCRNTRIFAALCVFLHSERGDLSKTYEKKKERYAYLVIWKRRKLSNLAQGGHSGSHAIAWAAITIFVLKVFLRPPNQNMALQCHASWFV